MSDFVSNTRFRRRAQATNRFQFALSDLLVVTGLTIVGHALFIRLIGETFSPTLLSGKPLSPYGPFVCNIVILAATGFGAYLGFWRSTTKRRTGWRRLTTAVIFTPVGWFFLLFFVPPLYTRTGWRNESAAMAACKDYAYAQEIYHQTDYNGNGILEYAQSLHGNDSLFETKAGTGDLALINETLAMAGAPSGVAVPRFGYFFKVLKAQGPAAHGGAKSYLMTDANGKTHMTEGYALVASPALYDHSGLHTFIISREGIIYAADLGEITSKIFEEMTEFNPDSRWKHPDD